jgi:DNA-binding transcriptional LysR family regulator
LALARSHRDSHHRPRLAVAERARLATPGHDGHGTRHHPGVLALGRLIAALDADVIKTYVELGLGVGVVASIAIDPERDRQLQTLDARHLFEISVTRLAVRRGNWLRGHAIGFIEHFAPQPEPHGGGRGPERPAGAGVVGTHDA